MHAKQAPPRPTRRTPEVILKAFEAIWPSIQKWLEEGDTDQKYLESYKESARKILCTHVSGGQDGYEIARMFDDGSWTPDLELANLLDDWGDYIDGMEKVAWTEWVKANGIEPRLKAGDEVRCRVKFRGEIVEGCQIAAVGHLYGTYTVRHDDFGHVPLNSGKAGSLGFVLIYEQVEAELPD
jgi:hypothetical protein